MQLFNNLIRYHSPIIILFIISFVASIIGIIERTDGPFSLIWLTNAIVIGVLLRFYKNIDFRHYMICGAGMILADLLIGTDNIRTIALTCANIISIYVGCLFLRRYYKYTDVEWFGDLYCVPKLLLLCQPALILGTLTGSVIISILYDRSLFLTASYWYLNESLNFIVILPVILTIPKTISSFSHNLMSCITHALPSILLLLLFYFIKDKIYFLMASIFIVPAIVWLALSGNIFLTTFGISLNGTFLFLWLIHSSHDHFYLPENTYVSIVRSIITSMALCALMIATAIKEREYNFQHLSFISNHDDLTGILNRRAFIKTAEETIASLKREDICTMVLIDIDFFKKINDKFGHQTGDKILIEFCYEIKKCIPTNQLFGRIGGEEFALLFSNTHKKNHRQYVNCIVNHFSNNPIIIDDQPYPLTVSAGMAEWVAGNTYEILFKYADQSLYLAKNNGRNQWQEIHNN